MISASKNTYKQGARAQRKYNIVVNRFYIGSDEMPAIIRIVGSNYSIILRHKWQTIVFLMSISLAQSVRNFRTSNSV